MNLSKRIVILVLFSLLVAGMAKILVHYYQFGLGEEVPILKVPEGQIL